MRQNDAAGTYPSGSFAGDKAEECTLNLEKEKDELRVTVLPMQTVAGSAHCLVQLAPGPRSGISNQLESSTPCLKRWASCQLTLFKEGLVADYSPANSERIPRLYSSRSRRSSTKTDRYPSSKMIIQW